MSDSEAYKARDKMTKDEPLVKDVDYHEEEKDLSDGAALLMPELTEHEKLEARLQAIDRELNLLGTPEAVSWVAEVMSIENYEKERNGLLKERLDVLCKMMRHRKWPSHRSQS